MSNVLVIGYYDHSNLGDEMFKEVFPLMLPSFSLKFAMVEHLVKEHKEKGLLCGKKPEDYRCIIFGGGNLIVDYFLNTLKYIRSVYSGPIHGMSIGVPYPDLVVKGSMKPFDHMIVRFKSIVHHLQMSMGTKYVKYYPDFVMKITPFKETYLPVSSNKSSTNDVTFKLLESNDPVSSNNVGFFPASAFGKDNLKYEIVQTFKKLLKTTPYTYHFIAFDTDSKKFNDVVFNKDLAKLIDGGDRIIVDTKRYTGMEMVKKMRTFRFGICTRFHSHILSIVTGLPFVSFHYSNKVTELMSDNNYKYCCPVALDHDGNAKSFKSDDLHDLVLDLDKNRIDAHDHIKEWCLRDQLQLDTPSLDNLIKVSGRRKDTACKLFLDRVDKLTDRYSPLIKDGNLEELAEDIIYDITGETTTPYKWGMISNLKEKPEKLRDMIVWIWKDRYNKMVKVPSINMDTTSLLNFQNMHRAGWQFCIDSLKGFNSPHGTIMDVYLDATFGWSREVSLRRGIIPYTAPWTGFFHHTPNPRYSDNSITESTSSKEFKQSLVMCKGLFVMSTWLKEWLVKKLVDLGFPDIKVFVVKHPTLLEVPKFHPRNLGKVIKVVNIGAWLRNPFAFYAEKFPKGFKKYRLKGKNMEGFFPPEDDEYLSQITNETVNNFEDSDSPFTYSMNEYLKRAKVRDYANVVKNMVSSVKVLEYLPNKEYDQLLTHNIVYLNLYEASAANTLIEAMARYTPIIVSKIPPVVEYLGSKYPLYIEDLKISKLTRRKVLDAYKYLVNSGIRGSISNEKFTEDMACHLKEINGDNHKV